MFPSSYPQSGGNKIDVTRLIPFNNESNAAASTGGAFTTLLSINGRGYLDCCYAANGTSVASQIKVTIDGVVTVLLGNSTANRWCGVVSKKDLYPSANTPPNLQLRTPGAFSTLGTTMADFVKPYPTIDGSSSVIILGDAYIYFYKSLLLEYSLASGTGSYRYSGAYKS